MVRPVASATRQATLRLEVTSVHDAPRSPERNRPPVVPAYTVETTARSMTIHLTSLLVTPEAMDTHDPPLLSDLNGPFFVAA
jgi:hypothetical protein